MTQLMMVFMLSCPETIIINYSSEPVNKKLILQAKKTCRQSYNKCLKKLIKKKDRHHYGICEKGE